MYIMPNLPTNHTKKTVDRFVFTQTYLLSREFPIKILNPLLFTRALKTET